MNVYALTPTGLRPEGLALLGEYLNAQTYSGPLTWVIVDDCEPATRVPTARQGIEVVVVRPNWRWSAGRSTQAACMDAGLQRVPADAQLFILEDDDVYLPDYMFEMLAAIFIGGVELIGERDAHYYNVASSRWRILPGRYHSSLASTVCRGAALVALRILCGSGLKRMLDVNLWKGFTGGKTLIEARNVIGIKGLPGRPGIGVGHRRQFGTVDMSNILQTWIGEYADNYKMFRKAV